MIVVSDTSPVSNLIQIGKLDLLKQLYGNVFIPEGVYEELAFLDFQAETLKKENWIIVKQIKNRALFDEIVKSVDSGEAQAIVVAMELNAEILLVDEQLGRKVAEGYGLKIRGVLGVLVEAKSKGLIENVRDNLELLRDIAKFRIHPTLFQSILKAAGELSDEG